MVADDSPNKNLKEGVILVVAFSITLIILTQLTVTLTFILFTDRSDEEGVIGLIHSFEPVSSELEEVLLDFNSQSILLLNVTVGNQTYHLYSESFNMSELSNLGSIEIEKKQYIVIWPSSTETGKEYIIDGEFIDLYQLGSTERVAVLLLTNVAEYTALKEFFRTNQTILSQILIGLTVLTVSSLAALIVSLYYTLHFAMPRFDSIWRGLRKDRGETKHG